MSNISSARKKEFEKLDAVIEAWKDVQGGLLPIMQQAQEICGCVDEEVQRHISEKTGKPLSVIYGVSTFYSQFTLQPKGKYKVAMCLGTACYVRGAAKIIEALEKEMDVHVGGTTNDGLFTLDATRCIGCCGLAPAMMINDEVFGRLTPADIPGIIGKFRQRG
ncbi:MAG: NAD(P)H-dependent oxidoreductase subunit E [Bacillota bacterium]|jgi:NADH:ubiquinone oxidoreductase subunit E